jgi:adenylate cyclase
MVKTTGDGILVEFGSVVDAVKCAIALQRGFATSTLPPLLRIEFRIGINVGDVIADGDDILGDSVNIAARLEALAEPGGICVSAAAYHQVYGKVNADFADMGEQRLHNIARPVRTYRIVL